MFYSKQLRFILLLLITAPVTLFAQTEVVIESPPATANALSGWSTAIDGNWAVVTAPQKDVESILSVGEIYFYYYDGDSWVISQTVEPEHILPMRNFGFSASMHQGTAVISAVGNHRNDHFAGSIYVYELVDDTWVQADMLNSSDSSIGHRFGHSTDVHQDVIVSGAYMADGIEEKSGAAYVFEKIDGSWTETAKLYADDGLNGDHFGYSTHIIDHQTIAIGAYRAEEDTSEEGAVYIFSKSGDNWVQTSKLTSPNAFMSSSFGYSLTSLQSEDSNETILFIGAPGSDTGEKKTGAVYVFAKMNHDWNFDTKFSHDEGSKNNHFGISMAVDGLQTLYVGASRRSASAAMESGSLYAFNVMSDAGNITLNPIMEIEPPGAEDFAHFGSFVSADENHIIVSSPYTNRDSQSNSGSFHFFSDMTVSIDPVEDRVMSYGLNQNYPNPFNPTTTIRYQLPESNHVRLDVYDILGRQVATLLNDQVEAGAHTVSFDASSLASGIYFYTLKSGGNVFTKKLTLIK